MNIHRRGKSRCEKLPENGYKNGVKDNVMLEYRL